MLVRHVQRAHMPPLETKNVTKHQRDIMHQKAPANPFYVPPEPIVSTKVRQNVLPLNRVFTWIHTVLAHKDHVPPELIVVCRKQPLVRHVPLENLVAGWEHLLVPHVRPEDTVVRKDRLLVRHVPPEDTAARRDRLLAHGAPMAKQTMPEQQHA